MIRNLNYDISSDKNMSFTYCNENNESYSVKCNTTGWSEKHFTKDEYNYQSNLPIADCFDSCSINKNSLKNELNRISFIIVEALSDVCSDNDLKKILINLPMIIGEIKSDDSYLARYKRLSKIIEELKIGNYGESIVTHILQL